MFYKILQLHGCICLGKKGILAVYDPKTFILMLKNLKSIRLYKVYKILTRLRYSKAIVAKLFRLLYSFVSIGTLEL